MKKLFCFIATIFKGLWKLISFLRVALLNLLFIGVLILAYFSFFPQQDPTSEQAEAPKKEALVLNLEGPIVEQRTYVNPFDSLSGTLFDKDLPKENVLYDIVSTIRFAAADNSVSGLVLNLKQMPETNLTTLR